MGPVQAIFSGLISVVFYAVLLAGVIKLFQISTDLGELKDLLRDIKRNTQDPLASQLTAHSPESLLRAVSAESYPPVAPVEPAGIESER